MSTTFDAAGLGELSVRLGLVSEAQVRECLAELDDKKAPAEELVRLLERRGDPTPPPGGEVLKGGTPRHIPRGLRPPYKKPARGFCRVCPGGAPRGGAD